MDTMTSSAVETEKNKLQPNSYFGGTETDGGAPASQAGGGGQKKKKKTGLIVAGILILLLAAIALVYFQGTRLFKKELVDTIPWGCSDSELIQKGIVTKKTAQGMTYLTPKEFFGLDQYQMPVGIPYSSSLSGTGGGIQAFDFIGSADEDVISGLVFKIRLYYGKPDIEANRALYSSSETMQYRNAKYGSPMKSMSWSTGDQIVTLTWETSGTYPSWSLFIAHTSGN